MHFADGQTYSKGSEFVHSAKFVISMYTFRGIKTNDRFDNRTCNPLRVNICWGESIMGGLKKSFRTPHR